MENKITELDFFTKSDISASLDAIEKIINTGIFNSENNQNLFVRASFTQVLIYLRDLMYKSEKYANKRINFRDDVTPLNENNFKVNDVTDLIKFVRDAICHPDVPHHYFSDGVKASFNIAYGKSNFMQIDGIDISSEYEDDVCFFFGKEKIYLNRHIIRAYNEAKEALIPFL